MASSLFSTRPACLSTSFSSLPSQVAISSSGSSFVSIPHFRQASSEPISLSRSSVLPSIECSSRPRKKCTAHHNKTRPKKHRLSDKNRKPPVYPKPPKAPPIITLGWGDEDDDVSTPAIAPQPAVVGV